MANSKRKIQVRTRVMLYFIIYTVIGFTLNAQELPAKEEILQKMTLANRYFMEKWPDVGKRIVTDRSRASNIWTRAVYYEGLMALYKLDPRPDYYDFAVRWGEFHNWDLRDGDTYTRNADNQCAGQTYIDLYLIDPKPERIEKIKESIDSMMRTTRIDDWDWIDALQMAMPVFARLGAIYQDNAYYERMYEMYMYTKLRHGTNGLYNKKDGLWWRDKDFDPPYAEPNGEDCYWSRGNGWIIAALVRVLDIMPDNAPHRKEYVQTYKKMVKALIPVQREDGFWNVSLHDPDNFGGKETTGTALFTYGIAWGINNGLLCEKKYKPVVIKAWNAMVNQALHPDGMLGYVQSTGKEPGVGQPVTYDKIPDFEDFGLGCFLLAGSEVFLTQ
jgi:unsaturated rhamnogalacturonyl hydrolase